MILRRLVLIGGLIVAVASTVGPVLGADNCVPQVHIVYFGSTAVNPTINATGLDLFGTPLSTCSADIKTYQKILDLNGDGTAETCTRLYVASSLGSCEGVEALDRKENNFNVCTPVSGSTTQVLVSTINDEGGQPLFANFAGSDVGSSECTPTILGCTLTRPNIFTDTESRPFVIPFALVVNDGIRPLLHEGEGKTTIGAACPHGANNCVDLKFGLTDRQGKALWGADSLCDWRDVSPVVHSATPVAIGSLLRQAKSGTRRDVHAQILQNFAVAPGNWFTTGTGNMITRVNNNQNCINPPAPVPSGEGCGETPVSCGSYTYGGGLDNCRNVSLVNYLSVGQIGTDRLNVIDPNATPLNFFDDVPIRGVATDHYDVLRYNGTQFTKANVECGFYEYWTFERFYYDNVYMAPGSFREAAIQKIIARAGVLAGSDPAVVAATQMLVSRAQDGEPIFTTGPHSNALCTIP